MRHTHGALDLRDHVRTPRAALLALCLPLAAAACGARTGVLDPEPAPARDAVADVARDAAPDVTPDVTPDAPFDAPPDVVREDVFVCTPGVEFALTARAADALLVIDRSGSMRQGFDGSARFVPRPESRWGVLESALAATLPMFAGRIDVGAMFYPDADANEASACVFPEERGLDVEPSPGGAAGVIAAVDSYVPVGSTPTYAGLRHAYRWIVGHPNRARARYIVLTTDGAPNCNAALDPATCVCTSTSSGAACGPRGHAEVCLDDARTVELIREIASDPAAAVPTYVIGIAPDGDPVLANALTAMAVAGGRPRVLPDGTQSFYSVRAPGELAAALGQIQNSIARCSFVAPSDPEDPEGLSVRVGGVAVPRDPARRDGWDWTDPDAGEVTLFGAACERAEVGAPAVTARVECRDAGR